MIRPLYWLLVLVLAAGAMDRFWLRTSDPTVETTEAREPSASLPGGGGSVPHPLPGTAITITPASSGQYVYITGVYINPAPDNEPVSR